MRPLALCLLAFSACVPQQPSPAGSPQSTARPIDTPKPNTSQPPALDDPPKDDPPAANPTRNESGTRLRVRYLDGADGSRAFIGFYDNVRKEECTFLLADDGQMRCLPAGLTLVKGTGYYEDAACSKPLAYTTSQPCGVKPAYAAMWDQSACPTYSTAIYEVGAQLTAANIYVAGNGCTAIPRPTTMTFYKLGARVPDDEFASATKKTE